MLLNEEDIWLKNYGNLYRKLSIENGEIPIGLYRTVEKETNKLQDNYDFKTILLLKLELLKINNSNFDENNVSINSTSKISYVLINPSQDYELQPNDIIYILRPGNLLPEEI